MRRPGIGDTFPGMPEPLSLEEVRHVARLARLRLDDEHLETYRSQLATVLDHISMLERLDVEGVEPMAHPLDVTNRLDADEVAPSMPVSDLLANAPSVESDFLAVPKVLADGGGGA
jgi:aspartyl/glutamyl-tRNA(Asn/Gln) amidotransferase C subunit